MIKKIISLLFFIILILAAFYLIKSTNERIALKKIIERLSAESRVAEVLVTDTHIDHRTNKTYTTIKFLEYDTSNNPLPEKYFTFSENIIHFQALVIRFDDFYIKKGDSLKGKSAYIFMKAFVLTDKGAEIFKINGINEVPSGYKVIGAKNSFERKLWQRFWEYALGAKEAQAIGIKNVQIEAPATKFIPGMLYTIKIEHDGGLRIDSREVSPIFKNSLQKIKD